MKGRAYNRKGRYRHGMGKRVPGLFLVCILLFTTFATWIPASGEEVQAAEPLCGIEDHVHDSACYAENTDENTDTSGTDVPGTGAQGETDPTETGDGTGAGTGAETGNSETTEGQTEKQEDGQTEGQTDGVNGGQTDGEVSGADTDTKDGKEGTDGKEEPDPAEEEDTETVEDSDEIQAAAAYPDPELGKYNRPEVTTPRSEFDAYTVETVQPEDVTVNLFDYWIETEDAVDNGDSSTPTADSTAQGKNGDPWRWNYRYYLNEKSINWGHALIFGPSNLNDTTKGSAETEEEYQAKMEAARGNWAFGKTYNSMTGNGNNITSSKLTDESGRKYIVREDGTVRYGGPWTGIVNRNLNAEGYPVLNVTEDEVKDAYRKAVRDGYVDYGETGNYPSNRESLAYLFDPNVSSEGKRSYADVTGLFQINEKGNYYYDSDKNFASIDTSNPDNYTFDLYNAKGATSNNRGNFFPFNEPGSVFEIDGGELTAKTYLNNEGKPYVPLNYRNPVLNHYFGLTMETDFMQPRGGIVGSGGETNTPMTFEFFGDDDIWIYIDGVLVSDLGGVHDYCYTKIDFSTGEITVRRNATTSTNGVEVSKTTLAEQFEAAGQYKAWEFNGGTFRDNSLHEMKVFYLERGNYDSNLRLEFNMISPRSGQIIKVNQDGKAISGAEFALYEANVDEKNNWTATDVLKGNFVSGADGTVILAGTGGEPIDFDPTKNYILREVRTPDGYVTTGDIHLTYNEKTSMLEVVNKWTTGAVASFEAQVYQAGDLKYYSSTSGDTGEESKNVVDPATGQAGLIIAVPFFSPEGEKPETREGWEPMYGSVSEGFHTVRVGAGGDGSDEDTGTGSSGFEGDETAVRTAALEAALRQIQDSQNERWYLEWNAKAQRYEGILVDLPGSVDRYLYNNTTDGDMNVAYYLLNLSVFGIDGAENMTTQQKYEALLTKLGKEDVSEFAKANNSIYNIRLLDISGFNRQFYTRLYIPNQARKFEVLKQNEEGELLENAEFTLYSDEACTTEVAKGKTDEKGKMSFSVENTGGDGLNLEEGQELPSEVTFALGREKTSDGQIVSRSYWLKETKAPAGYDLNPTKIEVRVTRDSTYIYAGDEEDIDDGVKVRKGLSVLLQTMVRYAASSEIDVTLRDVTLQKYLNITDKRGENITEFGSGHWELDEDSKINLHYGLEGKDDGFDYGIHKEDSGSENAVAYYETEYGWLGYGVKQNYDVHKGDKYDQGGRKTQIKDEDISALFPDTTQVVVTDKTEDPYGNLTIVKKGEADADGHAETLPGAEFKIEKLINTAEAGGEEKWEVDTSKETGYTATKTTDKDGKASFEKLPYGRYRITETKAPAGYQILGSSIDVTIDGESFRNPPSTDNLSYDAVSKTITVTLHNDRAAHIAILKQGEEEEDGNIPKLPGAEFKLEKLVQGDAGKEAEWKVDDSFKIANVTTDKQGSARFENLPYGTYRITEVRAPSGYVLLKKPVHVTLSEEAFEAQKEEHEGDLNYDPDSRTITVTMVNEKGLSIPTAGGMGIISYVIAGVVCITAALLLYKNRKRG